MSSDSTTDGRGDVALARSTTGQLDLDVLLGKLKTLEDSKQDKKKGKGRGGRR